jgi:hypothetical protein
MREAIKKIMRQGRFGGPMVTEEAFDLKQLQAQMDIIAIAGVSKETIHNAFGVPMALSTKETNLANLSAARQQHALLAVLPRCNRSEARLNMNLVSLFDERLFLAYDNPVPEDVVQKSLMRKNNLSNGVTTINEERAEDKREPVEWGDEPWISTNLMRASDRERGAPAPLASRPGPKRS